MFPSFVVEGQGKRTVGVELHLDRYSFEEDGCVLLQLHLNVIFEHVLDVLLDQDKEPSQLATHIGVPVVEVNLEPAISLLFKLFPHYLPDWPDDIVVKVVGKIAHHQQIVSHKPFESIELLIKIKDAIGTQ